MSRMNESAYRESEAALSSTFGVKVEEHFVDLPDLGTPIRVLETGAGDPILFIHGSPNNAATWIPLVAELPDHEFAIAGQLVADAGVSEVEHRMVPDPRLLVRCELLLLEDA